MRGFKEKWVIAGCKIIFLFNWNKQQQKKGWKGKEFFLNTNDLSNLTRLFEGRNC